jgi:hypothetical protein
MNTMISLYLRSVPCLFDRSSFRWRIGRSGSASIILASASAVLFGFMALAIDTAKWESTKVSLQGATDLATIAAGRAYRSDANVTTEAIAVLAAHGFRNGVDNVRVVVSQPPTSGIYAGNSSAIDVAVSQPQQTIFASVLHRTAPVLNARATTAPASSGGGGCIITLATTGTSISLNGSNVVDISKCNVYNNSSANNATSLVGGGTLKVLNAYLTGNWSGSGTFTAGRSVHLGASPVADPYATRVNPTVPSRCDATNAAYSQSVSFTAGTDGIFVFCGGLKLTGSGNTLTLGSGTYMFDRGTFSINGDWTINGSKVSIIFTSSTGSSYADLKVQGNQQVNLVAPSTGNTKGLAIWMHRSAPSTATVNFGGGSTLSITGAIYAASAGVTISGSNGSSGCTQIVARTIVFNGNNTIKHDCSGVGISDPPGSLPALVLVQ